MGNTIHVLAANSSSGSGSSYLLPVIIVVLFGLFYFVMIRPQRNRQRQITQMQQQITPGARIRTTAGMYATVVAVEDQDVILEAAPGVQMRFLRRAIMDVVSEDGAAPSASAPAGAAQAGETEAE